MQQAGLAVHIDTAGNMVGHRAGSESLPPIVIGSHADSVPGGGNYDGQVGVIGAIEVAQVLQEKQLSLRHPLEVVIFSDEEGGLTGSRAMIGELTARDPAPALASSRQDIQVRLRSICRVRIRSRDCNALIEVKHLRCSRGAWMLLELLRPVPGARPCLPRYLRRTRC